MKQLYFITRLSFQHFTKGADQLVLERLVLRSSDPRDISSSTQLAFRSTGNQTNWPSGQLNLKTVGHQAIDVQDDFA